MILERHTGHSLTVKPRTVGGQGVPNMRLACDNCNTVLVDLPPPRSMMRAIVEKPETVVAARKARRPELEDNYFEDQPGAY